MADGIYLLNPEDAGEKERLIGKGKMVESGCPDNT